MIMENKVSLWLGNYINAEELNSYINIHCKFYRKLIFLRGGKCTPLCENR